MTMRPKLQFLTSETIQQILSQARDLLCKIGMKIYHDELLSILAGHGAVINKESKNVFFTDDIIDKALKTVPCSFGLYDVKGNQTHDFSQYKVHFTPASSSLNILDAGAGTNGVIRKPHTRDYIRYVKLVSRLPYIASQSTAFIPADVSEKIGDSYRLYLSLLYGEKPMVTGTFNDEGLEIMKQMLVMVRGTEKALKEKPLAIFSCCPTTPLKWSEHTCADIMACARSGIPVELVSMPLAGFTGPVTLMGSLVGHTAETLSGIAISQLVQPGAPLLYGGAPAVFDVRYETTPMGAVETQMMDCAYNEIGKYLNIPTQAYVALSDAKTPDYQAGLETSMGATMAALSGINNISGPGMLDFINCFSLEKLVLDNEICGMLSRLVKGIEPREDFPATPRYEELLKEQHLLISKHTRRYLRQEHYFPGSVIDRTSHERWLEQGSLSLAERTRNEMERLIAQYEPSSLAPEVKKELAELMATEARRCGMEKLPDCD